LTITKPRLRLGFIFFLIAIFFFSATVVPSSILAQDRVLEGRVKKSLEELKNLLAQANEVLNVFENREARDLLAKAFGLYREAEGQYNRALTVNNMREREALLKTALGNINLATPLAQRAIRLALDRQLVLLRNSVEELFRRAEQMVIASGNRDAERLLRNAQKQKLEADRAMAAQNYVKAVASYNLAKSLAERALKLVEGTRPTPELTPETTITREKERFENIATRAREAVETGKNPAARAVFEQAQKQARAAEDAFRKGELVLTQQLYRGAARLLLRAIDLAMAGQQAQDYGRNELALLQDLIQTAEQEAKENMTPRDALLLERSRTLAGEAEAAVERKQAQEAKWRIELARNLVDKVMRKAGGLGGRENLARRYEEALQELARDIEEVRAKARAANHPEALQLVELAATAYRAAENAGQQSQPARPLRKLRLAFQLIRTAQYFLLRAETLLREPSTTSVSNAPTRAAVAQQLAQLENSIQALRQAPQQDDPESCGAVAMQAMEMSKHAQAALERGEARVALTIIEVAKDLIEQCVKGR
ncbi:MAG: hypothetical protein ACRENG_13335, partial [bacterium]